MNYVSDLEGMSNKEGSKAQSGNELRIDPDKCNGCGLCAEACFCGNIDASVFPPVFRTQDCGHDLFCEGICPTGALEFDFRPPDPAMGKRPGGGMEKALDLAEATGRFRRLTKMEDIGWQTPWEVATERPRHREIP
jgi:ferredoxin